MKSKFLIITILTTFILAAGIANAADITVTCYDTGSCDMSPSAGEALWGDGEEGNTNMLPGHTAERTINLVNDSDDACEIVLGDVTDVRLIGDTHPDFPYRLWTAFVDVFPIYGGLTGGEADSTKSIGDLFDGGNLPITQVSPGQNKEIDWYVKFDPDAGNDFQNNETRFDFDMHFICDQIVEDVDFTISKTTSSWPSEESPGNIVGYTIVITSGEQTIYDVVVTDLLPETFEYVGGSWNIASNMEGSLAVLGGNEPTYASPGDWDLGTLAPNEVVTLTYDAKILEEAVDGIYPDLAFATGRIYREGEMENWRKEGDMELSLLGTRIVHAQELEPEPEPESEIIFARAVDSGFPINGGVVDDNFVGTQVKVNVEPPAEEPKVEIEEDEIIEEEEVLGAAIQRLPATGPEIPVVGIALVCILAGLALLIKHVRTALMVFLLMGIIAQKAYAAPENLVLRISDPETPTKQAFGVDYVALDLKDRNVTAKCYLKKPGEITYTIFQTDNLIPGGDSGTCKVSEAMLTSEGTYYIKVTAEARTEPNKDNAEKTTNVSYDNTGPNKPKWIEKDKKSDCEYEVSFKTSDDGQTSYVEVYRSDDKEFTVGPGSRIRTINIGPDEEDAFTHMLYGSDCGSSYYAVRAFDDAGNYSDVRVEEVENIIIKEVVTEGEETITAVEAGVPLGEGVVLEGEVAGEEEATEGETPEEGEEEEAQEPSMGEEGTGEETGEEGEILGIGRGRFPWVWIFLAGIIIVFIVTIMRTRKKNEPPNI